MMDIEDCDSCGNKILSSVIGSIDRHHHVFTLPSNDRDVYQSDEYMLCDECIRKIVDFIDERDESDTRVDLVPLEDAADALAQHAAEVSRLAEELDEFSRGGD